MRPRDSSRDKSGSHGLWDRVWSHSYVYHETKRCSCGGYLKKIISPRDHEMFSCGGGYFLTFHHETKRCSRDGGYFKKISPWDQEIHPVINLVLMVTEIGYGAIPSFTTRPRDVLVVGVYFKTISLRDKEIQNLPWDLLMVSWWSWWLEDQEIHYVINLVLVVAAQCSCVDAQIIDEECI